MCFVCVVEGWMGNVISVVSVLLLTVVTVELLPGFFEVVEREVQNVFFCHLVS